MQFCFIGDGATLTLPVTPERYEWSVGRSMETVNISQLGDVYLPGGRARHSGTISCMLPAQDYPFCEAGAAPDPQHYLDVLKSWAAGKTPVRWVVTGTEINESVYLEEVTESEQDGTGDVYCTIRLREHVDLEAREVSDQGTSGYTGNTGRAGGSPDGEIAHKVVSGDTLSMLCRRYYGSGTAAYYNALAEYNGIKNPHLIYVGQTVRIPPKSVLLGGG